MEELYLTSVHSVRWSSAVLIVSCDTTSLPNSGAAIWKPISLINHKLWKIVDDLLGRGREPVSSAIDVEVFNQFLQRKLSK